MSAIERVILDVDAGTDDALAILLFLFAEVVGLVKIEAITCTHGNTAVENVANNVIRLLEAADRTDIPVYMGANSPLISPEIIGDQYYGNDGFGDVEWDTVPDTSLIKPEIASVAMGGLITQNPREINVIALGPLTNIGLAIKLFPNFANDVKSVNVMGGNFQGVGNISPAAEFNFYMDPESVYILLENSEKLVEITTWESSIATNISLDWRFNVLGVIDNPVLHIINLADEAIFASKPSEYIPADAYAAAAFLYPTEVINKSSKHHASIELHGSETRGQVVLNHINNTSQNALIIESLNEKAIKDLFITAATVTKDSFTRKSMHKYNR